MWHDFRLLVRFEAKRIQRSSRYWLRLLGFELNQSRALSIYVFLFWLFWAYTMWAYAVEQVFRFHNSINGQTLTALAAPIVPLIFGLQLLYLAQVLRDPPLKLASADLQYVATAPLSRGIIAWIQFMVNLTLPALVIALGSTLAAMLLAPGSDRAASGRIGLWAFVISLCLVYLSAAVCWSIGLLKQNQATRAAKWRFWAAIPLLLLGAVLVPQVMLFPGHAWIHLIETGSAGIDLLFLVCCMVAAFGLLIAAGNRLRMRRVIADSQLYARIQKLGLMGRILAADVIARIHRQSRLSRKRMLHHWFPPYLSSTSALVGQNFVSLMRVSPGAILRLFINGTVLVSVGVFLLSLGGAPSLPSWMILYILLLQLRPHDVVRGFRVHLDQPFMRQLITVPNLKLFLASIALPFTITALGMVVSILAQRQLDPLIGIVLSLSCLMVLTLCMALGSVQLKRYQIPRIAYEYSLLAAGVIIILSGYASHSLWGAAVASIVVNAVLMLMLSEATL